jgi:uncharacterized protein (TIGR03000 family)
MFRKVLFSWALTALAGAAVLLTATTGRAQGHGGYVGGYHPSFGYGIIPGSHPEYGYRPGWNHGSTYPYAPYPFHNFSYGSGAGSDVVSQGQLLFPDSYIPGTGAYERQNPPYPSAAAVAKAVAELDPTAYIAMRVPANAEVWFDGEKSASTGEFRTFRTPALAPGRRYTYEVRARWDENGREITQTQKVPVTAGADVTIDFPAPDSAGGRAADPKAR